VFEAGQKYYLLKLINRDDASEEEFEAKKEDIKQAIRKIKVQQRSDVYLDYLSRKMKPEINDEILPLIPLEGRRDELSSWLQDKRPLVKLRDSTLTAGEFMRILRSGKGKSKDVVIKQWINKKSVDYAALDRKYYVNSDLKDMTSRYKNKMLMKMFVKNALSSKVEISESELMDYYRTNEDDFLRPAKYKLQQITSKTKSDAETIKKELLKGADFSWMAKNRSFDNYASAGGTIGWKEMDQLADELKGTVDKLAPGEISDVITSGNFFRIYRVQEKTYKKVEKFETVRSVVHKKVFRDKYKALYESYVDELKKEAHIEFNDEVIRDLDHMINNGMSS